MNTPLVSIITATYNSSHLLRYAIQSVVDSDFQDWELLVVGDCCMDDSEEVVKSFCDDRILFFNLKENSGQQAKPNNFGLEKAQGKYIAFLNQDDFFFPDHLSRCLVEIENSQADFMIIPGINILSSSQSEFESGKYGVKLCSVHPDGKFSTNSFSVASTWFLRKSVAEKLGPWEMEKNLYTTPSQEWVFRAYHQGVSFHFPHRVGTMIISSGARKNSYKTKSSFEHDYFSSRRNDSALKAQLLEKAAVFSDKRYQMEFFFQPKTQIKRMTTLLIDWAMKKFGIHPNSWKLSIFYGGKGGYIKKIRKDTGLD